MQITKVFFSSLLFILSLNVFSQGPSLPEGLGKSDSKDDSPSFEFVSPTETEEKSSDVDSSVYFDWSGFVDMRSGVRTQDAPAQRDISLGELRSQFAGTVSNDFLTGNFAVDFLYDPAARNYQDTNIEKGNGLIDLREAYLSATPLKFLDVKFGRQILTWGTGDFVFINDLFPKDWRSFFLGRDVTYLKAPSDAIKLSFFNEFFNTDLVYTPRFDSDRFVNGSRLTYFSPLNGAHSGHGTPFPLKERNDWFDEGEYSLRLSKTIKSMELALYAYQGYWKSPNSFTPNNQFFFPRLQVFGSSLRAPFLGGISNLEFGYYNSQDDSKGSNPLIMNSQNRFLIGHERELVRNITLSFQYFLEETLDYDEYKKNLNSKTKRQQYRQMLTGKIHASLMRQNLDLTGMFFYGVSEDDLHVRLNGAYKLTDQLEMGGGVHLFEGRKDSSFWGRFDQNSSLFSFVRFNF